MSSNKRRKLDVVSDEPQLSAFAARQALKSRTRTTEVSSNQNESLAVKAGVGGSDSITSNLDNTNVTFAPKSRLRNDANLVVKEKDPILLGGPLDLHEDDQLHLQESRVESPDKLQERRSIVLSSFKPTKFNVKESPDGDLLLTLSPGERLVIVGQYEVAVQWGQITLMGMTLQPSEEFYRVFAATSHSLPVIRCLSTDINSAGVLLRQCESGLESLKVLSPLFGKLWNNHSSPLGIEYENLFRKSHYHTFQVLFSSRDGPQKTYLQPLISPPEWNFLLSNLSAPAEKLTRKIMICGPKSSGKSTFAKLLTNRLLSTFLEIRNSTQMTPSNGIALLDLDPGQPEYSPPGQLALVHVQEPNFGTPFSHPIPGGKSTIIRSHSIGSTSPSLDPSLYMACVLDLFAHYSNPLSNVSNCPLIINTPGWVFGTGLEILVDLIAKVKPTEIVYMSQDGPPEVYGTLKDAAKLTPLVTLPSQVSEYTTRTAAHLRTMQAMSYFHLDPMEKSRLSWKREPLTSIPPWEVGYSGENPGMVGVICYGEQPPADLLVDTINGSLVAVVVIDDMAAIPGWDSAEQDALNDDEGQSGMVKDPYSALDDTEIQVFNEISFRPEQRHRPLIEETPAEGIPYFNPANTISLDPRYSHSVGLALVRGIDVARKRIQLLTPIEPRVIEEVNESGKSIVLISGKLDTPGWAYIEELNMKIAREKASRKQGNKTVDIDDDSGQNEADDTDMDGVDVMEDFEEEEEEEEDRDDKERRNLGVGFENAPWIERLEGSQGRGVGSRVWRVRRDLGRIGDGGD